MAGCINSLNGRYMAAVEPGESLCFTGDCGPRLDWIITGGESGKGARPMHLDWARQDRDQCAAAGVAFFFKQWGAWLSFGQSPDFCEGSGIGGACLYMDGSGKMSLLAHNRPDEVAVRNVGKAAAGRLLDGVEHNGMPGGAS